MPITPEIRKQVLSDIIRQAWADKTPEEREKWKANIKKNLKKAWKKGKYKNRKKRRKQATE